MPIKRFFYAAKGGSYDVKEPLSCCETGFVVFRKSLFHNAEEPLSCGEIASLRMRKSLFHDIKKAL